MERMVILLNSEEQPAVFHRGCSVSHPCEHLLTDACSFFPYLVTAILTTPSHCGSDRVSLMTGDAEYLFMFLTDLLYGFFVLLLFLTQGYFFR